jgi:hypothetical protein
MTLVNPSKKYQHKIRIYMSFTQLIYCSIANQLSDADVDNIVTESQKNNPQKELTGLLLFTGTVFFQCLEGSRVNVNALYQQISQDRRHRELVILSYRVVTERDFGRWAMARVDWNKTTQAIMTHHLKQLHLVDEETARTLLRRLASYLEGDADESTITQLPLPAHNHFYSSR